MPFPRVVFLQFETSAICMATNHIPSATDAGCQARKSGSPNRLRAQRGIRLSRRSMLQV